MMGLSDGERISMTCSAVLIHYTRVTDRQTVGKTELTWHIRAIAYMLSRVKIITRAGDRQLQNMKPKVWAYDVPDLQELA